MSSTRKTAFVICPGRGSYGKEELASIAKSDQTYPYIAEAKEYRRQQKQKCIFELDAKSEFSIKEHLAGENASGLIYVSSYLDFMSIDQSKYDVIAMTGNSLGWYTTLSLSQVVEGFDGFALANTMGSMMRSGNVGHQVVYPILDDQWRIDQSKLNIVRQALQKVKESDKPANAYVSIEFGGYVIIGVDDEGSRILRKHLPPIEHFPLKMAAHAAFHTPLLQSVSDAAFDIFSDSFFKKPKIPIIDGQGNIWQPYSTDIAALRDYTLGHQVTRKYSFSKAVDVGIKEFAPDVVILLGPGSNTGGAIAQTMIAAEWSGVRSKDDFMERQKQDPILLAMGRPDQRLKVV